MAQIYKRIVVRTNPAVKFPNEVLQDHLKVPVLQSYKYVIGLIKSGAITQILNCITDEFTYELVVVFNTKADLTAYLANANNLETVYNTMALTDTEWNDYCIAANMTVSYTSGSMPVPVGVPVELSLLESLVATLP